MRGNYLAPIESPSRILDVGTGTGQWAFDLCEESLDAVVVGLDLTLAKPARPANFLHVPANVLSGLPFQEGSFDFVHQRLLVAGVPPRARPDLARQLVAATRPGGWTELVETDFRTEPAGSATMRLYELICQLAARRRSATPSWPGGVRTPSASTRRPSGTWTGRWRTSRSPRRGCGRGDGWASPAPRRRAGAGTPVASVPG